MIRMSINSRRYGRPLGHQPTYRAEVIGACICPLTDAKHSGGWCFIQYVARSSTTTIVRPNTPSARRSGDAALRLHRRRNPDRGPAQRGSAFATVSLLHLSGRAGIHLELLPMQQVRQQVVVRCIGRRHQWAVGQSRVAVRSDVRRYAKNAVLALAHLTHLGGMTEAPGLVFIVDSYLLFKCGPFPCPGIAGFDSFTLRVNDARLTN